MRKSKILIIDDDMLILKMLSFNLEKLDFEILTALNGEEGLLKFKAENADLVITDILMPKVDGVSVLKEVKKFNPQIEVIMLTANASLQSAIECIKLGAFDFILKPINIVEILNTINNALNSYRLKTQILELNTNLIKANEDLSLANQNLEEKINEKTAELILAKEKAERNEAKYKEQSRIFDLVFEHTLDNIVLLDKDYNFIKVSETYAKSCQKETSDLIGKNHFEVFPSDFELETNEVKKNKKPYSKHARPFVYPDHPEWGTSYWDIGFVPILGKNNDVELFILTLKNITEEINAKNSLLKLNRIYSLHSNVNHAIVKSQNVSELFCNICRISDNQGQFPLTWIGKHNITTNKVDVVCYSGKSADYLRDVNIDLSDSMLSKGPTGRAIKTGKHVISPDIENDVNMAAWKEKALRYNLRSSISMPIMLFGKVYGALNFYADEKEFFDTKEIKLLDEIAKNISYALEFFHNEFERKKAEESQVLFRTLIDYVNDVIVITDPETGTFIDCNKNTWTSLGYTKEEFLSLSVFDLDQNLTRPIFNEKNNLFRKLGSSILETEVKRKDGSVFPAELSINLIQLDKEYIVTVLRDITERKLSEKALIESQQILEGIMNSINVRVFWKDINSVYLGCNKAFAHDAGLTTDKDIIGKNDYQMVWKNEADLYRADDITVISSKTPKINIEEKQTTPDGKTIYVLTSKIPLHDVNGEVCGVLGTYIDITDRKKIEKDLAESERRYRDLFENSPLGIYRTTPDGEIVVSNPALLKMMGFSSLEECQKRNLENGKYTSYEREEFKRRIAKDGQIIGLEAEWYRTDNTPLFVCENAKAVLDNFGNILYYDGTIEDITVRKNVELELIKSKEKAIESEEKYRLLYEFNPMPMSIFDIETLAFLSVNNAFIDKYGFSKEEFLKMTILDIRPESEIEKLKQNVGLPDNGITNVGVYVHKKKNGELMHVEIIRHEIVFNNKKAKLVLINDVTNIIKAKNALLSINEELRLAKEKAEESDKLKSAFLANMSHEIRTPLNSIVGFSKIIAKKNYKDTNAQAKMAELIDYNSQVLVQIIDDIIDLSKIESGILTINNEYLNIEETLKHIISVNELTRKSLKRNNIELRVNNNPVKGSVIADKVRLGQIFNNLISNALKYTIKGQVEIGYDIIDNNTIRFFISDTGIGISEEEADMIFTRFYKAKNEIATFRGIGLGLPITKQLVEKMNGKIWLESKINVGTTFYFTLPFVITETSVYNNAKISHVSDLKGKRILIAEDDDGNFLLAKMILSEFGAEILRAENGQEAVQICKKYDNIDIVLMDMKMPVMDGIEATKLIKQFRKNLIIIALSANVFDEAKAEAFQAGCDYYVSKPINEETLVDILQS